jgi:hypothetical protein
MHTEHCMYRQPQRHDCNPPAGHQCTPSVFVSHRRVTTRIEAVRRQRAHQALTSQPWDMNMLRSPTGVTAVATSERCNIAAMQSTAVKAAKLSGYSPPLPVARSSAGSHQSSVTAQAQPRHACCPHTHAPVVTNQLLPPARHPPCLPPGHSWMALTPAQAAQQQALRPQLAGAAQPAARCTLCRWSPCGGSNHPLRCHPHTGS